MIIDGSFQTHNGHIKFDFNWQEGIPFFLIGENGIGKSSFFHFLKWNIKKYFPNEIYSFMDQGPLRPLGNGKVIDLFCFLQSEFPKRTLYSDKKSYFKSYPLIETFNFTKNLDKSINALSGGENQILKILIQFFLKSDIYLFDEPTQHLDEKNSEKFYQIIKEQNIGNHKRTLIIEHDSFYYKSEFSKRLFLKKMVKTGQPGHYHFLITEGGPC